MPSRGSLRDRGRLFSKVVYIYFCLFSMAVAELFSMSMIYGAALYFSLAALFHVWRFSVQMYDTRGVRVLLTAAKIVFILAIAYIIFLYPLLYTYEHTAFAIIVIALPFVEREVATYLLRRHARHASLSGARGGACAVGVVDKRSIAVRVIPTAAVCTAAASLIALTAGRDVFVFVLLGMVFGMMLAFFRQYAFHDYAAEYTPPGAAVRDVKHIRSIRLYDGMVISSGAALNIFAFTYILVFMFSRDRSQMLGFFVLFCTLTLIFCSVYLSITPFLKSSLVQRIGKNAAFVLGTAVSIFAVYIFADSWYLGGFSIALQTVLLLVGLMLQTTGAHGLKEDIFLVARLYNPDSDADEFRRRAARLDVWTSILSETVFTAALLILISDPVFYMLDVSEYIAYAPIVGSSLIAIPTALLFVSLVYSLKQPLTMKVGKRLAVYTGLKKQGNENQDMKKRLTTVLVDKYKKRIGVHIIRAFLKPIMSHKVVGREHVADLPGIFVFNHAEIYGPIAAIVFLPYDIRPWILSRMIDRDEITAHIYDGTFSRIRWLPAVLLRALAKAVSPIVVWALSSFDPIPVYRGSTRDVVKTFSLSIACLNAGDSILLFPENPEETYQEQVSAFYKGFANLGRLYYKRTGNKLTFYPVYASKRQRELRIGEGVRYDPDGGKKEKDRIVDTLEARMKVLQSQDEE